MKVKNIFENILDQTTEERLQVKKKRAESRLAYLNKKLKDNPNDAGLKGTINMAKQRLEKVNKKLSEDWTKAEYKRQFDMLYKEYSKMDIEELKKIYTRSHRVSDLKGVSKSNIVSDIVHDEIGDEPK
jgi:iron-sulfur cluster repair protein YtfE (RIC family)